MKQIKFFFFVLFLSSCYTGNLASQQYNTPFNLPSVGDSSSPSSSEYFYFDIDEAQYRSERQIPPYYEISTTEEYGDGERVNSRSNCEILLNLIEEEDDFSLSESSETLVCILDLLEGDIQAKDLHLTFNFPEGMCSYVRTGLPWHFNYEIQEGPRTAKCQFTTGSGEDAETEDFFCDTNQTGCTEGNDTQDCPSSGSVEEEEDLCSLYKPLCCAGGLKEDGEEWEPDLECVAGPALIAEGDTALPEDEFYKYLIRELPEGGLRESFTLPHGIGIHGGLPSSLTHANYIKILDKSPEGLRDLESDSLPAFLQDSSYDTWPSPRLFFEFDCLDAGSESLHKILVMIREWNTLEEFWDFYLVGGDDSTDPDVTGIEGDDCPYEDRRILEDDLATCNDHFDMDDIDDFEDEAFPEVETWEEYLREISDCYLPDCDFSHNPNYPSFDYSSESE